MRRRRAASRMALPRDATSARATPAVRCSTIRTDGIECERARQPQARTSAGIELRDRLRPGVGAQPGFERKPLGLAEHVGGGGSISSVNGMDAVLDHGQLIEQHRALADDAEAVDEREPFGAVGDRRRRTIRRRECRRDPEASRRSIRLTNTSAATRSSPTMATVSVAATCKVGDAERTKTLKIFDTSTSSTTGVTAPAGR